MMLELQKLKELTAELVSKDEQLHSRIAEWGYALDAIDDMIFIVNADLEITFINRAFKKRIGLKDDFVLGQKCYNLICKNRRTCFEEKRGEFFIVSLNGWFDYNHAPIVDDNNNLIGYISILKDITARKKAEENLRLDEERLEALLNLTKERFDSEEDLMKYALEEAIRLTNSKIGYLHFVEPNKDNIELNLSIWSRETLKDCVATKTDHYPLSEAGIWADCLRTGNPVIHNDYKSSENKKGLPDGHINIIRHMSVPIFNNGSHTVVGIMGVGNKTESYDSSDVRQLNLFANNMWDIVVKRRATRALEKEKNRMKNYLNIAGTILLVLGKDERVELINKKGCELLGLTEEEILGKNWFDTFIPKRWRAKLRDVFPFTELLEDSKSKTIVERFINPILTKDGEERLILWNNSVLEENGKFVSLLSSGEDITDIEKTKKQLENEVDKFRFIYEESPVFYQSLDDSGMVFDINKKWANTVGYEKEDVIGKPIKQFLDPNWKDNEYYFSLVYLDKDENIDKYRPRFLHKNGYPIDMIIDSRIVHEQEGLGKQTHCILHEFTERCNE